MDRDFYVYEHWIDDKCLYVGGGHGERAYDFRKSTRNKEWQDAVYRRKNEVKIIIVKTFESKKEAFSFEKEQSLKRRKEGHPLTNKADGYCLYGEVNGFYNKKHSPETKLKISRQKIGLVSCRKGIPATEEQKIKQREIMKGRKQTLEHILAKSNGMMGKMNHSDKTREKISRNTKPGKGGKVVQYKVRCIETGKIYDNLQRAQEDTNAKASNIRKVVIGERKIAGGLRWERVD